jgi:hypothetical protein
MVSMSRFIRHLITGVERLLPFVSQRSSWVIGNDFQQMEIACQRLRIAICPDSSGGAHIGQCRAVPAPHTERALCLKSARWELRARTQHCPAHNQFHGKALRGLGNIAVIDGTPVA